MANHQHTYLKIWLIYRQRTPTVAIIIPSMCPMPRSITLAEMVRYCANKKVNQITLYFVVAPASNHPVPVSQPTTGQQMYSPSKNTTYTGGYQSNLSHTPSSLPPVTQTLPPTQPPQITPTTTTQPTPESSTETTTTTANKPQANGTPEKSSPPKSSSINTEQQNHVAKEKQTSPLPPPPPPVEKNTEKATVEVKEKTPEVTSSPPPPPPPQQQQPASQQKSVVVTSSPQTNVSTANTPTTQEQQQTQSKVASGNAQVVVSGVQTSSPQAKPKEQVRSIFFFVHIYFFNVPIFMLISS